MGTQLPLPQRGTAPQFSAHNCCGQMAAWIKMPLGMELGLGPGDYVLPLPKRGPIPPPKKSACVYCGQTAGWMKLVLDTEVGLSPGDFVLDGDPAPSLKRGRSPQVFGPYLLWPNGWMDRDASWHERRPQPRRLCVRWVHSPLTQKGSKPPPQFSAHFFCGQTARCIEMPLGMEVGLRPEDFVSLGTQPLLPKKEVEHGPGAPNFRPMSIVAKRLDGSRWHLAWK